MQCRIELWLKCRKHTTSTRIRITGPNPSFHIPFTHAPIHGHYGHPSSLHLPLSSFILTLHSRPSFLYFLFRPFPALKMAESCTQLNPTPMRGVKGPLGRKNLECLSVSSLSHHYHHKHEPFFHSTQRERALVFPSIRDPSSSPLLSIPSTAQPFLLLLSFPTGPEHQGEPFNT